MVWRERGAAHVSDKLWFSGCGVVWYSKALNNNIGAKRVLATMKMSPESEVCIAHFYVSVHQELMTKIKRAEKKDTKEE